MEAHGNGYGASENSGRLADRREENIGVNKIRVINARQRERRTLADSVGPNFVRFRTQNKNAEIPLRDFGVLGGCCF